MPQAQTQENQSVRGNNSMNSLVTASTRLVTTTPPGQGASYPVAAPPTLPTSGLDDYQAPANLAQTVPEVVSSAVSEGWSEFPASPTSSVTDSAGRVTDIYWADPDGSGPQSAPSVHYTYDTAGKLTQMTLPDGATRRGPTTPPAATSPAIPTNLATRRSTPSTQLPIKSRAFARSSARSIRPAMARPTTP